MEEAVKLALAVETEIQSAVDEATENEATENELSVGRVSETEGKLAVGRELADLVLGGVKFDHPTINQVVAAQGLEGNDAATAVETATQLGAEPESGSIGHEVAAEVTKNLHEERSDEMEWRWEASDESPGGRWMER